MDELVQWLRAQLDEDERVAREADAELSAVFTRIASFDPEMAADERHIMTHRPTRVLCEIDTKRLTIDHYQRIFQHAVDGADSYVRIAAALSRQIQIMASVYAGRPGYRDEWRP